MSKGSQTATGTNDDDGGKGTNRNRTTPTTTIKLVYPVIGKAELGLAMDEGNSNTGNSSDGATCTVASNAHPKQARKLRSSPSNRRTSAIGSEKVSGDGLLPIVIENIGSLDDHLYLLMLQPAQMELLEDLLTDLATSYQGVADRKKLFKDLQMLLQAVKQAGAGGGIPPSAAQAEVCFQLFQSKSKPSPKQS